MQKMNPNQNSHDEFRYFPNKNSPELSKLTFMLSGSSPLALAWLIE